MMRMKIATCQFPVSADITKNMSHICDQIRRAKNLGADIVHFCEGAMSGYVGHDLDSFDSFDWPLLRHCTQRVMDQTRQSKIHVLLGSSHPLSGNHRPHNSVYVFDQEGQIVSRYDKRFCASNETGKGGELDHFTPGDHLCTFTVNGIKCGILICHEYRYPELYRQLKQAGVDVVFHSFHAANQSEKQVAEMESQVGKAVHHLNKGRTYPAITMPAAIQTAAQCNYLWISAANSSARRSMWASFVVRPDGVIAGRLRKNTAGILISPVDTAQKYYDSTRAWRDRAMKGQFHSGELIEDPRSDDLRSL